MSSTSLSFVFLILTCLLCLKVESLTLKSTQSPLNVEKSLNKVLGASGFPQLIQTTFTQSPTQTLATLFSYYIDGRVLDNLISSLFNEYQENNVIPYQNLVQALHEEGVEQDEVLRILKLVSLDQNDEADFSEFREMSNIVFHEALSVITFAYIVQSQENSHDIRVDLQSVESAISKVFHKLEHLLPPPRCEEIEFLFKQSDKDGDSHLNIQEFHYLLSIFLRYYRTGIQNNEYANIIFHDQVFAGLWVPQPPTKPSETQTDINEGATETADEPTEVSGPDAATETEVATTEGDTFGFSYWYSDKEETEETETADELAGTEAPETEGIETESAATEATKATEGDTHGFSYHSPDKGATDGDVTETEVTATEGTEETEEVEITKEAEATEAIEATEATEATKATEATEATEVTEATEATEGDTYGFSYYYPDKGATEDAPTETETEDTETEDTVPTNPETVNQPVEVATEETEPTEVTYIREPQYESEPEKTEEEETVEVTYIREPQYESEPEKTEEETVEVTYIREPPYESEPEY